MPKRDEPRPERDKTDTSLRAERDKTDAELAKNRAAFEEGADSVVQKARERADQVLANARRRSDEKLRQEAIEQLESERRQEDRALEQERETADEELREERTVRERALFELLALEREQTDEHLKTERFRADADLATRDDFLGMVSHDLRTLLGGIALQAAILSRKASSENVAEVARDASSRIQRLTARMNRLIGDLVDVASIEAGTLTVVTARDDAGRLIRETVEIFQPIASAKELSLEGTVARDSFVAELDHERLLQVLANLVSNAIKFTPRGGRITVSVEPAGDQVRFSVADTGAGIPEGEQQRVFERFWQATKNDRRGLGLGLHISKCIIEAHGGRLWVESQPGQGSTFMFTVPASRRTDTSPGV